MWPNSVGLYRVNRNMIDNVAPCFWTAMGFIADVLSVKIVWD